MSDARDSPKLNMEHGFMQSIIKNQVDRDEYDKEQKLLKVHDKISGASRQRTKRPTIQTYVPPHLRAKASNSQQNHGTSPTPAKGNSACETRQITIATFVFQRYRNEWPCNCKQCSPIIHDNSGKDQLIYLSSVVSRYVY